MLNARLGAALIVAEKLKALEEALDDALISAAELTAAMPIARRTAKLSPVVGQAAIASGGQVIEAIHHARNSVVQMHQHLADVRNDIGLTPRMTGDLWKLAEPKTGSARPDLQVVA